MDGNDFGARDRGLALLSRINRWVIAGAVGLSGVLSVAAANGFHGRQRTQSSGTQRRHSVGYGSATSQQSSTTTEDGGSLQQPAQPPTSSPASASTGAVSGGS